MGAAVMKYLTVASIGLAMLCLIKPAQAEQHIICPPEVDWSQISVSSPTGWTGLYRPSSKVKLRAARVWIGPLTQVPGELIGETIKGKNGSIINRFPALDLAPLIDGVRVPMDKWMVCVYGDEGIVQAMKLPDNTKECSVTYRPGAVDPTTKEHGTVISSIACK